MAGYLYESSGRATWYTSAGPITNNTLYQGTLQSFGNGQTLTGLYKTNSLVNADAGNVTIQFSDATHGTLTWPGGTIPIERYVFGAGASSFQPESGWWWNESESGRGFTLEVQGNKLFIEGYMYDDQGNPIWYISAGNMTSATLYQGQWEQYANGQTLTGSYKKPDQVNGNVGSITIEFTSRTTATLTLPDGRQIALTRYRFYSPSPQIVVSLVAAGDALISVPFLQEPSRVIKNQQELNAVLSRLPTNAVPAAFTAPDFTKVNLIYLEGAGDNDAQSTVRIINVDSASDNTHVINVESCGSSIVFIANHIPFALYSTSVITGSVRFSWVSREPGNCLTRPP